MIHEAIEDEDAPEFIERVDAVLAGLVKQYEPPELVVVRIDNWFGPDWLRFSGKTIGALGIWKKRLTVPPFVPNRVVRQRRFAAPTYDEVDSGPEIHAAVTGGEATQRRVADVAPGAALVWLSGRSLTNGRGAIMAYAPVPDAYRVWYAGYAAEKAWQPTQLKEIGPRELAELCGDEA